MKQTDFDIAGTIRIGEDKFHRRFGLAGLKAISIFPALFFGAIVGVINSWVGVATALLTYSIIYTTLRKVTYSESRNDETEQKEN